MVLWYYRAWSELSGRLEQPAQIFYTTRFFFCPLGIGGNLVAIQSSRISTRLHLNYLPGEVPADRRKCYNPCSIFFGSGKRHKHRHTWTLSLSNTHTYAHLHPTRPTSSNAELSVTGPNHRSAQILLLLVIPGQMIFLYSSHLMKGAKTMPSFLLTAAFLAASAIQVSESLKH